jgi:hypothetical protein
VPARIATLTDTATGELKAYVVVVAKRAGEALVADFLADSSRALTAMLSWIAPRLAADGFERATTYFLGSAEIDRAIQAAGFQPRNEAKFVIAGSRDGAPVETGRLARTEDWYLTEADRDN